MRTLEQIRKDFHDRKGRKRLDDGWITINGTHVQVNEEGQLHGSVGEKISSTSKGGKGGASKSGGSKPQGSSSTKTLTDKQAKKIYTSATKKAWISHSVPHCLNALSEKMTGWDDIDGQNFGVSYEGSANALAKEIASTYQAAGVKGVEVKGSKVRIKDGSGRTTSLIGVERDPEGSTFTDKDKPYYVYTEDYM